MASLSFSVGEYQVKCSEASQFFSQTPCGYLVGFPSLFLIWFIPQSQLVFAFHSVGGKACEKVLTATHPRQAISSLNFPGCEEEILLQINSVFSGLCCCCCFVRQIYIRKSEHLEKVQFQTVLQVSAWTRQILITATNLSSAELSRVFVMPEILFIAQGLCSGCSSLWHKYRISDSCQLQQLSPLVCLWFPAGVGALAAAATSLLPVRLSGVASKPLCCGGASAGSCSCQQQEPEPQNEMVTGKLQSPGKSLQATRC